MPTFDDYEQTRVMQDGTFQLREENGETILCPDPSKKTTRLIVVGALLEWALLAGIIIYFTLGPGNVERNDMLMIGVTFTVFFVTMPCFIGTVLWSTFSAMKRIRFRRLANGNIALKDATGGDVRLNGIPKPEYVVESTIDRDGNEVHDLFLKQEGNSYYILSGKERDEMLQIRDALQN